MVSPAASGTAQPSVGFFLRVPGIQPRATAFPFLEFVPTTEERRVLRRSQLALSMQKESFSKDFRLMTKSLRLRWSTGNFSKVVLAELPLRIVLRMYINVRVPKPLH